MKGKLNEENQVVLLEKTKRESTNCSKKLLNFFTKQRGKETSRQGISQVTTHSPIKYTTYNK